MLCITFLCSWGFSLIVREGLPVGAFFLYKSTLSFLVSQTQHNLFLNEDAVKSVQSYLKEGFKK